MAIDCSDSDATNLFENLVIQPAHWAEYYFIIGEVLRGDVEFLFAANVFNFQHLHLNTSAHP
jgi:hypothetical protein